MEDAFEKRELSDPIRMAGCLDITGWKSSLSNLRYDIMLQDYDDHTPSLMTFVLPFDEPLEGEEQRILWKLISVEVDAVAAFRTYV